MANLVDNECSASECSLICNDYWEAGYGRILMVPRVKLAYDKVGTGELAWLGLLIEFLTYRKCLTLYILKDEI